MNNMIIGQITQLTKAADEQIAEVRARNVELVAVSERVTKESIQKVAALNSELTSLKNDRYATAAKLVREEREQTQKYKKQFESAVTINNIKSVRLAELKIEVRRLKALPSDITLRKQLVEARATIAMYRFLPDVQILVEALKQDRKRIWDLIKADIATESEKENPCITSINAWNLSLSRIAKAQDE